MENKIAIFWFRRDLRINDNTGLDAALSGPVPVLPIFIFDPDILKKLPATKDSRVLFIYSEIEKLKHQFEKVGSTLVVYHGKPSDAFRYFTDRYIISAVYANRDYEPYALKRDEEVRNFLNNKSIEFHTFKDHVIFEAGDVLKSDGTPYTVFTPYSRKWKETLIKKDLHLFPSEKKLHRLLPIGPQPLPLLNELGFETFPFSFPSCHPCDDVIERYGDRRDLPGVCGTTRLGIHLRFGTISIREIPSRALNLSEVFLNELIWRNYFIQILENFPFVLDKPFKARYQHIPWRNNEEEFKRWCEGETGYPLVDAGMRELNHTGFMHNRVRMVTASFLTKHLLIDWRWGETYFAGKLLDFELASNNGNWQWAAGTGCDAAPYFRVFNPIMQQQKFDPDGLYIRKWVPEAGTLRYVSPIVEHNFARNRAINTFKKALGEII